MNIFDKNRNISPRDEILTKSFLIDKIANDMKAKYKKVFSLINYDENSLKNDIHNLLAKYISNKHREINIKYIETTILNKVREKYKGFKKPLNPVNKNKKLIKIIYPTHNKYNSYLNLNKKSKTISSQKSNNNLEPIQNNSINKNYEIDEKIEQNYYTNENSSYNIANINEEDKKGNNEEIKIQKEDDKLKKNINEEQEEIIKLEKYQEDLQKQIDEINKEIEIHNQKKNIKEDVSCEKQEIINKDMIINENKNNEINQSDNQENNNFIEINNLIEIKNENNRNPLLTYEQQKYLERKKRIEEDFYNKQNRYIFLKPRHYKKEEEENLNNNSSKSANNIYNYDNIKINKYSMDKLNDFNKIKEKIRLEKEKQKFKNSTKNIYEPQEDIENNKNIKEKGPVRTIPYEEKIKLRILQRSLEQERAIEHLRNLLYPQKQLIAEKEYQGFNGEVDEKNLMKLKELKLADEARKIQIEKMKKLLNYSIDDRKKKRNEENEIDKKYREMAEKEHELFLEKEKQKKLEKAEKIQNYRKMLDEQIQAKKKIMIDENNLSDFNKDFGLVE